MPPMSSLPGRDPRLSRSFAPIDTVVVVVVVVVVTTFIPIPGVMMLCQQMVKTDVQVRSQLEPQDPDEGGQQCEGTSDRLSFRRVLG